MKHSPELKSQVIKEIQEAGNISLVCKKHGLKPSTVHGWLKAFNNKDEIDELAQLRKLKKDLANSQLENKVLKELLKKTYQVWNNDEKSSAKQ